LNEARQNADPQLRQLAAILFRKHVTALWSKAPEDAQTRVKAMLLHGVYSGAPSGWPPQQACRSRPSRSTRA